MLESRVLSDFDYCRQFYDNFPTCANKFYTDNHLIFGPLKKTICIPEQSGLSARLLLSKSVESRESHFNF